MLLLETLFLWINEERELGVQHMLYAVFHPGQVEFKPRAPYTTVRTPKFIAEKFCSIPVEGQTLQQPSQATLLM